MMLDQVIKLGARIRELESVVQDLANDVAEQMKM